MKNIIIILGLSLLGVFSLSILKGCSEPDTVSPYEFYRTTDTIRSDLNQVKQNQKVMQLKIDSIMQTLDVVQHNQINMLYQLDTLKAGQILIYSEMTAEPDLQKVKGNWADGLINYLQQ